MDKGSASGNTNTAWVMLLTGAAAFVSSGGRWNIAVTAWIWPFCFLYYSRKTTSKKQFAVLAVVIAACSVIKWLNALAAGYFLDALFGAFWSLCWIIPFAADRLLTPRLKGSILQSLVFPSVFTALDYLRSFTPTGSLGMIAYTQEGVLPLVQIVSVTGSYGLAFLIYWFASAAVTWAEKRPGWKRPVCIYAAVITCVLVFGAVRLTSYPSDTSETVKVACVVGPFYGKAEDGEYSTITYEESERYLVSEAGRAAKGGADIACWNEEAFAIQDKEEQAFLDTAKTFAAENDMILVIGYETADTDGSEGGKSVDKSVIILPDGTAAEYIKTHLVPVMETSSYVKGTGDIPTVVTDSGVISNVICFDDCFNGYMHGTGANTKEHFRDTEIMFVPSWDWSAVKNAHTDISEFRAIENGESLVKVTYDGISTAVDNQGHVMKRFDTADTGFDTMQFVEIPAAGVHTIYSRYGAIIDAAFLLSGIMMLLVGLRSKERIGTV